MIKIIKVINSAINKDFIINYRTNMDQMYVKEGNKKKYIHQIAVNGYVYYEYQIEDYVNVYS